MKILFFLLLCSQIIFSQKLKKVETYNFGHNGMELIVQNCNETIIISTFNSKITIRDDIASIIYQLYISDKLETNKILTINGCEANVTGKCIIKKKDNLILVDFYYEKVEWKSGLIEIYKKSKSKKSPT